MTPTEATTTAARKTIRLPAILAMLAGVTDVTSWILLGGLFTAHITGNLVVLAANLVSATPPRLAAVLALPVFILIAVVATLFALATQLVRWVAVRSVAWFPARPFVGGVAVILLTSESIRARSQTRRSTTRT